PAVHQRRGARSASTRGDRRRVRTARRGSARRCRIHRRHMSLTVMQKGTGAARPLVAAFGPLDPGMLRIKLGPAPCIVVDSDGHGLETMAQVVDFAAQRSGATSFSATALIGFSIGCSRVRALRLGGANAGAYLLMDGTHANWPPEPWQIQWIRELADQA